MSATTEPDETDAPGDDAGDDSPVPGARKKRTRGSSDPSRHADGHALIEGARWHYPAMGDATRCAVTGCDRVLGAWRDADPLEGIEADDDPGDEDTDS